MYRYMYTTSKCYISYYVQIYNNQGGSIVLWSICTTTKATGKGTGKVLLWLLASASTSKEIGTDQECTHGVSGRYITHSTMAERHTCTCTFVYAGTYMYTHTYIICVCTFTCTCTYIHTHVPGRFKAVENEFFHSQFKVWKVSTYPPTHTHTHTHTHTRTHTHSHTTPHTHTQTHTGSKQIV